MWDVSPVFLSIEHLVPQSVIGTNGWTDSIVGQVGNLILVSEELNGKLKDKPFIEKKKILLSENFILPPEIVAASDWTPDNIRSRSKNLAATAYSIVWKI